MHKETALITGASSGIGLEMARIMAAEGHDLVLTARSLSSLNKVKQQITADHSDVSVSVHAIDLSVPGSAKKLHAACRKQDVSVLVNNAGAGYVADFFDGDLQRHNDIAYLNMNSLMQLCHLFGADFKQKGHGKILNVASIAAFLPGPAQPVYYATKAFVRSLSRALHYDLRGTGVSVTSLHPGVTRTAFFEHADAPDKTKGADPRDVARLGYQAMMRGRSEVTYGLQNKLLTNLLVRITPYRLQPYLVDKASDV